MPVYRPVPRRGFEITPASTPSSPPSPSPENQNPELLMDRRFESLSSPSRNRSILNLTTSTLFGIFSGTGGASREESSTPWGTGAQTPSHRGSIDDYRHEEPPITWNGQSTKPQVRTRRKRMGIRGYYIPLALQSALLFGFGVAYGSIVTHLHETRKINPVPVPVPGVERGSIYYHVTWGMLGIILGNALPLMDALWSEDAEEDQRYAHQRSRSMNESSESDHGPTTSADSGLGPIWYSAVRSIGAFVGIAFAVVCLLMPYT